MPSRQPLKKVLAHLAKDIKKLMKEKIEGIEVSVTDDLMDIRAKIDGPQGTPYENGIFYVRVLLSDEFPITPPKAFFLTKVFHPNVNLETGEICVDTLKRDWSSNLGIRHVLLVIRCLLIHPNPESALNEEAGRLLLHEGDYLDFAQRAKIFTQIYAQPSQESNSGLLAKHDLQAKGSKQSSSSNDRGMLREKLHDNTNILAMKNKKEKKCLKRFNRKRQKRNMMESTFQNNTNVLESSKEKKKKRVKRIGRKRQKRNRMERLLDRL